MLPTHYVKLRNKLHMLTSCKPGCDQATLAVRTEFTYKCLCRAVMAVRKFSYVESVFWKHILYAYAINNSSRRSRQSVGLERASSAKEKPYFPSISSSSLCFPSPIRRTAPRSLRMVCSRNGRSIVKGLGALY